MKQLLLTLLLLIASVVAGARTTLPEQSVVIDGFDEETARARLLESDLQPLEGIWYYPAEDMTFAIERWSAGASSHQVGYRLILIAANELELLPGTVIGYVEESAVPAKFRLWLYSERDKVTLHRPLDCVATLSHDGFSLTFTPPHWEVKLRVNFARFLPTIFRGVSILPAVEKEELPVGFKKIFPLDGSSGRFDRVRYL